MTRPQTTFDVEQFQLAPDTMERMYANVDNALEFVSKSGKIKYVPIVVPTALFSLLKETFRVEPSDTVQMYIVYDDDYYVFGIGWGADGIADLWAYTPSSLPTFIRNWR